MCMCVYVRCVQCVCVCVSVIVSAGCNNVFVVLFFHSIPIIFIFIPFFLQL